MTIFLVACGLTLAPTVGWSELLINEFLPDPAGTDSGQEFVELFNAGPAPVELAGVELQFANGSVGADWVTRWTGSGPGTIPAGGRFLIVDRNWLGAVTGDAEVYLGLQNGPDAIRLVRGPVVLDLVGYGSLTDQELFEGAPVPVPAGQALARRPDGTDTQDNAADFVAAGATPGARNFLPYSIAVVDQDFDPPVLIRPGDPLRVTVVLRNDGTEELVGGPCELAWAGGSVSAWWDAAPPDAERTLVFVTRPALRGIVPLTWRYAVPGGADTLRSQVGSVQIGASLMRLQEVMPAPDSGQGEWVEIAWAGPDFGNLAGHSLRDEDGGWVPLPALAMGPGQLVVVAADSSGLMDWWWANRLAGAAGCGETTWPPTIVSPGSWPSLNNTAPSSRLHADRVFLADPQGVVIDAVAWGGQLQELPGRNLSLERIGPEPVNPGSAHWMVSTSLAGSTPGCANSVSSAEPLSHQGEALQVTPPLLDRLRGPSAVHIRFGLAGPESSWEVVLFNLWGDQVRDFGGDARGAGPRDLVWDGRDDTGQVVGVGPYIAWLEIRSEEALVLRREKSVVVVR
ncbi:MAG: lamin tail domain-containing protein [Candidatus Krumholzibacteria bacterium]|nr:lamin tail domain-containing protein [Candidatus Krumholzibacteria bacterium]